MLRIGVHVSTHWARNFLAKIAKQRFYIHVFSTMDWSYARANQLFSELNSKQWGLVTLFFFFAFFGINYLLWQQVLCINQLENCLNIRHFNQGFLAFLALWNVKVICPPFFGLKMSRKTRRSLEGHDEWTPHKGGYWRVSVSILLGKFPLSFMDSGFDCATVLNKIYF